MKTYRERALFNKINKVKREDTSIQPLIPHQYRLTQRACGDIVLVQLMFVQGNTELGLPFGNSEWHEVPFINPSDVKFLQD